MSQRAARIALVLIAVLTIINAVMMGNWNAGIDSREPWRFAFGALVGGLYVSVPLLLIFFMLYRAKSIEVTSFRLGLWLPNIVWVIAFLDGMERIAMVILTPIYGSYGLFPILFYSIMETVRRKTNLKNTINIVEPIVSITIFVFVNVVVYILGMVASALP